MTSDPAYELMPGDRQADGAYVVPYPQLRGRPVGSPVPVWLDDAPHRGRVVGWDKHSFPLIELDGAA